jgi:energy-coupling factor transporter ATP-binding protein EcfA2
LANQPRVVLADEPTANLDTASADQVLSAMSTLWREQGVTFLLATHDPRILARATRVIYLVDGQAVRGPMHDPETGMFVRSYFEARLQQEHAGNSRRSQPTHVIVAHVPPTSVPSVAGVLVPSVRPTDTTARLRDDVLALLLSDASGSTSKIVVDRMESLLGKEGVPYRLTVLVVAPTDEPVAALDRAIAGQHR